MRISQTCTAPSASLDAIASPWKHHSDERVKPPITASQVAQSEIACRQMCDLKVEDGVVAGVRVTEESLNTVARSSIPQRDCLVAGRRA